MGTTSGAASRSRIGRVCRVGVADVDAPARLLIAPDARPRPGRSRLHRPALCSAARRVLGRAPHAASRAPTDSPPNAATRRHPSAPCAGLDHRAHRGSPQRAGEPGCGLWRTRRWTGGGPSRDPAHRQRGRAGRRLRGQHRTARPSFGVAHGAAALCSASTPAHTATHTRTHTHTLHRFDGYDWMILSVVKACEYLTLRLGVREGKLVGGLGV